MIHEFDERMTRQVGLYRWSQRIFRMCQGDDCTGLLLSCFLLEIATLIHVNPTHFSYIINQASWEQGLISLR